MKLVNTKYEIG